MTCREVADFIGDYLAADLPAAVRASFERHLEACPNCRRYLKSYEDAVTLGKRAFDDDDANVPGDVPESLVQAILASRQP